MKKILLWLVVVAVLVIGFVVYRSRSRNHLDVTPDARREIEKAKRR
jgi:cytochrome c-type biogenesis protein CcmH/NrfF